MELPLHRTENQHHHITHRTAAISLFLPARPLSNNIIILFVSHCDSIPLKRLSRGLARGVDNEKVAAIQCYPPLIILVSTHPSVNNQLHFDFN